MSASGQSALGPTPPPALGTHGAELEAVGEVQVRERWRSLPERLDAFVGKVASVAVVKEREAGEAEEAEVGARAGENTDSNV